MDKKLLYNLLAIFLSIALQAQTRYLDSLQKTLELHSVQDTGRVTILIQVCRAHLSQTNNMERLEHYNSELFPLSIKLNARRGQAWAYFFKGVLCKIRTDYPQAKLHLNHSLLIFKELKEKLGIAACYNMLALIEDRLGKYNLAIQYASDAAKIRMEAGDLKSAAGSLNNLAISYGNLGDYKQSLNYHFQSLALRESLQDKLGISVSYLNIGDSYNTQGKLDESEKFLMKALPLKIEVGDKEGEAYVYANLATIATTRKNYKEALVMHMKALKLREEMGDKQNINQTYDNIGANYLEQNKYDEALPYYLKALQSSKELGDKVNWIISDLGAGKCYEGKGSYQLAMTFYKEGLQLSEDINFKAGIRDALSYLSSVHERLNNYKDALYYQREFSKIKDSLLNEASAKQATELNTRYETDKKEKEILLLTKDQQLKDKTLKQQRLVRIGLIIGMGLFLALSFLLFNRYRYKQRANLVLKKQKQEISEKNMQITDSIDYAKTIQEAILPDEAKLQTFFEDYFILYRPKAIVSGDFYWVGKKDDKFICAVADCTGHGVPGAFMSLLGHNILENVLQRDTSINPGAILTTLNQDIVARFSKGKEQASVKHGMDIAIISIDKATQQVEYAGARNSLYLVRDEILTEVKANKMSTGVVKAEKEVVQYTNHTLEVKKGDMIYLFSDGFPDQKGGPEKKKFYYQPFKELLTAISKLPSDQQKQQLNNVMQAWIGEGEQIDDILIMGIRC
jgi:serine phosphatase RsbU (regulator of sigma subunit)